MLDEMVSYSEPADREKQRQVADFFYENKRYFLYYLFGFLGNYEDAEDVIGEIGLKLAGGKTDKFREEMPLKPWLYTLCTNSAIDYQRRQRKHKHIPFVKRVPFRLERLDRFEGEYSEFDPIGDEQNPLDILIKKENFGILHEHVERLPDKYKNIFKLRFYDRIMFREIAEQLGIPAGTAKSRYHQGMKLLLERLTNSGYDKHYFKEVA